MIRTTLLIALLATLVRPCVAASDALPRKTLQECIEIAIRQQPLLASSAASVEAARERVWESAAAYLPQVGGSFAVNRRHASAGSLTGSSSLGSRSQTFNFYSSGVSLSQVLFDFGQNLALIHRSQALVNAADADAATQHDAVVFRVEEAYFGLLTAYRLRDVAEETVAQSQRHLDVAQGRFDVGYAARIEVTQAQVQLANAELSQVTARNNVDLGRETLRNAMGLVVPLDFDIVDVLEEPIRPIAEKDAVALAEKNRPELRSAMAQEEAASEQISAIQKDYFPKLSGNGAYNWTGSDFPLTDSWNVGATVNISVFNGGLTTAQVGEAKANLSKLQADRESLRQNITLEVRQATLNLHQAAESLRVANKGLQQARENLELAEGRYSTGVGSMIELTDAQTSLSNAEANRVQSLANYRTTLAALERATAHPFVRE